MDSYNPGSLWPTLRRARLPKVLVLYLSASFVVLQVVGLFTDKLGLPDWFFPGAVALLLIGLPIIVATAFVQSHPGAAADSVDADAPGTLPPWAVGRSDRPARDSGVRELDADALGGPAPHGRAGAPAREEAPVPFPADDADARPIPPDDADARPIPVATPPLRRATAADVAAVARDWLTWRKSILGGSLAFLLLILAVSGYTAMRALGIGPIGSLVAAGVLDERDRILLAEFQSPTGDGELAAVVTEAFRVDIAQSRMVTLVEPSVVQGALARMDLAPETPLDPPLARELALREGIKAVITGEIGAVGEGYVLSARLILPETGTELAALRETAARSGDLLPSIDRLSKRLRERIGESLRSIRANEPLEKVTTGSLEALSKYTQAVRLMEREGDSPRAIRLLEEAIAADPEFAMAHRRLGIVLSNRGEDPARAQESLRRAYELRDRLTEPERYHTVAIYHSRVTRDVDRAIEAYRNLLDRYPHDGTALNNLGVQYSERGDFARAEEHYRRAIAADSFNAFPATNIIHTQFNLGDFEAARESYERLARRFPEHRAVTRLPVLFAYAEGDYEGMAAAAEAALEARRDDPGDQIGILNMLSAQATVRGRLAEAERFGEQAGRLEERRRGASARLEAAARPAFHDLLLRGEADRARARLAAALESDPLETIEPSQRPYGLLANFHIFAGEPGRAREYLAALDETTRATDDVRADEPRPWFDAMIALAEDRPEDAVRAIRGARPTGCPICLHVPLGQAFERLGQPESAVAAYEAYLETPFLPRIWQDRIWRTYVLERLADLHELLGDSEKAASYHAELVELWRDADPELQRRVRYAEEALLRLAGEQAGR